MRPELHLPFETTISPTDLLEALDKSGTPESTLEAGRKFVRLVGEDGKCPKKLIQHLHQIGVTEGTIHKAIDLATGRKRPEDYHGTPPVWSTEAGHQDLAKKISVEIARMIAELEVKKFEKQAEVQGGHIGNPKRQREEIAAGKR